MKVRMLVALVLALVAVGLGYGVEGASSDDVTALGPGVVTVEIDIEHSRFDVERVDVHTGTLVRFVVRNLDPIPHELIVGDDDVHARHRIGTERFHPPVPGELALGPGETGMTVHRFDEPGTVVYACHLAGHLAYGMEGTVRVH